MVDFLVCKFSIYCFAELKARICVIIKSHCPWLFYVNMI